MNLTSKTKFGVVAILLIIIGGIVWFVNTRPEPIVVPEVVEEPTYSEQVIGTSVEGREIEAISFGNGERKLLFVGGIHGGYEWNSVYLAYRAIDYLKENPMIVPADVQVTIIPNLNPDGLYIGIGAEGRFDPNTTPSIEETVSGRFNANDVDLNRNFDCKWQPSATWRSATISAGDAPFSEPEARILRDYILETNPDLVTFWHSQGGAVYGAECEEEILPATKQAVDLYATASGYSGHDVFDAYPVTGDAEAWLASIGIPAITVELETHETIEWNQNLAGIKALLQYYGK
ncbi:MAG: hypothetical protein COV34_01730 [Candidatus Zambryskibacteria bacterium CG10_big_fil_rev_8_21_14_0_10_42_12]|uniref:Peptidase M14 domain-containing protein n=1 Tax=Candidatus Zambryskibacteria bacterium CG10_big_fil_rev_8_21_14_0_10_42_12 TaxID=1975115 RepID=A0A2H0QVL4_9BACT|nr:MAG: hypothetical protein COV34_01730 [Candidatus Zambryskibacteria bacterium CG10_big_fil_rev_8_21_14_0_10_42_12]